MDEISRINESLAGRYTLGRELGRGGMATVYLAHDERHGRDVALKVLRPEIGQMLGAERFLAEIRLTAGLQHPNILPLFDSGAAGDLLFYVMPYVRGETLRSRLTREQTLDVEEAITIARGIAGALDHAHRQGVVHRDIKPENVLLSDGVPMVADFGIARAVTAAADTRVTQAGTAVGTPAYMSPEQAMGESDVDRRADLYSLGCVLFEMLTGDVPYPGATPAAVITQHMVAPVPSPRGIRATIPPVVDNAIVRALAKERNDRFTSAAEMSAALTMAPPVEPLPDYSKVTEPVTRTTTPLVGRRREFAELVTRLDALKEGRGAMVLIGGEPGVGKTKLTEALLLEARARGYIAYVGHCYEMDGAPPYLPFLEQLEYLSRTVPPGRLRAALGPGAAEIARIMPGLRQLFPDIPEPLDLPPDQQRHYLFTQFREYIQRGTAVVPSVILFDDLHWADDSTLLLLEYLAPYIAHTRVLMLGTYRDVELDVNKPFAKSLERLTRQRLAERIALRRMPESDVADLLAQLGAPEPPAELVHAIFAETEGNPFFVEEVFQHLREEGRLLDGAGQWLPNLQIDQLEVPEGVRLVIGRRLERVSAACRTVLTAAAVIGPRFDLAVLEALGEVDAEAMLDALEEAERAGLVIAQQSRRETHYTFAHELIRQTLLGTLAVPRRLRRHLRTAEAMEKVYAGKLPQHASELAYHYFQSASAQHEETTTRYLLLAGRQALAAGAFDEALAQVEKAFSIMETPDDRRHADLLGVKASALKGLGRWESAIGPYKEVLARYEALGAQAELIQAAVGMAEMLYYTPGHDVTAGIVAHVLDVTPDTPSADRARLLALGANALTQSGRFAEGMAMSDRAVAMAEAIGDAETRALVLCERAGNLQGYGLIAAATPLAEEAHALLAKSGKRWAATWAGVRHLWNHRFGGRPREVIAMTPDLLRETAAIGHLGGRLTVLTSSTSAEWMLRPHVDQFGAAAETMAREFTELGSWGVLTHLFRALEQFERDDGPAAIATLEGVAERFGFEAWQDMFWTTSFAITARTWPERARAIFDANAASLPVPGQPAFIGSWQALRGVVMGLVWLGDPARAASLHPLLVEKLGMGFVSDFNGLAETTAGIAAAAGDEWEVAERHFSQALELAIAMPHVPEQMEIRYWHAWMLLRRRAPGDLERAGAMLEEARPLFERAGRRRWVRECEELLRVSRSPESAASPRRTEP